MTLDTIDRSGTGRGSDRPAALVTGGASGIGYAVAQRFGAAGASVLVADIDEGGGRAATECLQAAGVDAVFCRTDVSSEPSVRAMVATTTAHFGRIDWACNAAGIGGGGQAIDGQARADWDRVLAVNLTGVWMCLKHQCPAMHDGGAVVNIASVAGLRGLARSAAYVSAKHGVVGLTRTAAIEFADAGLRVNAVCPGAIDTPLLRRRFERDPERREFLLSRQLLHRLGTAEEIADAVMWLCGAGFITGQAIAVDGGWTVS